MKNRRPELENETDHDHDRHPGQSSRERGSALVIALLIMVIMTLLGISFLLVGDTEAKIARNQRDAAQAGFVAEGGVKGVQEWFEKPSGSGTFNVPTTSQMDRSLRWVDPNNNGTYVAYSSAASPYNVVYRQGTDDPFSKPYRGSPSKAFLGDEFHPDIRISSSGSSNEQTFLTTLNTALYPSFPSGNQQARIRQIDVYSPPILVISGTRTRYGIATIKVIADVYQNAGTAQETRIASKTVKAVINELPYTGPTGPLQSCKDIDMTGNARAHWGTVTTVGALMLNAALDTKADSSVPWYDSSRIIARDLNQDGTLSTLTKGVSSPDDRDGDGNYDFDTWVSSGNLEDPWLRFKAHGAFTNNPGGCSGADCIPQPWWTSPSTFTNANDHSNIVQNAVQNLCVQFDYTFWKQIAQSGEPNVFYYASDGPATGTYRLNGTGPSVDFETAAAGGNGLYFFDTTNNSTPVDANSDGTYDNLCEDVTSDGPLKGLIYLNANFITTGGGGTTTPGTLIAPAEPYIDANGNGLYDDGEYYIRLTYPGSPSGTAWTKSGGSTVGAARQDPAVDAAPAGKYAANLNVYGLLYTNGSFQSSGNWVFFGAVVSKAGIAPHIAGSPDYYFDERMIKGMWPPPDLNLPKTVITAWQTDM